MPSRDYPGLLALVASRAIDPRLLVGRVIGLDGAGAALAAMSDGVGASGGAGAGAGAGEGASAGAGMTVAEITH